MELQEYVETGQGIKDFYEAVEGLQRKPGEFNIPEVMNWIYHKREEGHDLEWIKQAIRDDAGGEWKSKHPGEIPPDRPVPPPPIQPPAGPVGDRAWGVLQLPTEERIPTREYSYWPHVVLLGNYVYAMVCSSSGQPRFYKIDPSGFITSLGPLIRNYNSEGEGWYFSPDGSVYLIDGPRLRRVSPFSSRDEVVFDISDTYSNHNLWQAHSSLDGRVHCATVRQNSNEFNPHVATMICDSGVKRYIQAVGTQDESHITSDGTFCIIEVDNDNQIINVQTGEEQLIRDGDGALSHIDCGPSYMVGEDNIHGRAWRIDLPSLRRTELEQTWGMGHVAVQNGRCLLSNSGSLMWMDLNGGGLTHILDHGMVGDQRDYDYQVKANIDFTATVALYMTNNGGGEKQVVKVANLARQLSGSPAVRKGVVMKSSHRALRASRSRGRGKGAPG